MPHYIIIIIMFINILLGMTVALAIVNRILKGDQNQIDNYLN